MLERRVHADEETYVGRSRETTGEELRRRGEASEMTERNFETTELNSEAARRDGGTTASDFTLRAETKLYYDLFTPAEMPAPLLVALHGYGSSKQWMMREARHHAPVGFAVAALQGPH